jgi:diguanylate cyclase (GGDEF)-like protein
MQVNILLFLPNVITARQWSEAIANSLSARVRLVRDMDQLETLLVTAKFDAAVVATDLADDIGSHAVDSLLNAKTPVLVTTNQLTEISKALYSNKAIVDYVVGCNTEALTQAIDILGRLKKNKNTTVLIVDDSAAQRGRMSALIHTQNLRILTAENGQQALDILSKEHVSLMLTDYHMPIMDGLELTKAARLLYGKHELAIVVLTASSNSQAADFLKYGANDFLSKPFTREELTCRVNQNLDIIYLMMEMHDMAHRDFLTSLHNRRYFLEKGTQLYNFAKATSLPMVIAMIDIDHFKRINDTWGHDVGDDAIRQLAEQLNELEITSNDIVSRLGGEEFAVIMTADAAISAPQLLEGLRKAVESNYIENAETQIKQTISIGWVNGQQYNDLSSALTAADHYLYAAKASGRNCIMGQ